MESLLMRKFNKNCHEFSEIIRQNRPWRKFFVAFSNNFAHNEQKKGNFAVFPKLFTNFQENVSQGYTRSNKSFQLDLSSTTSSKVIF